MEMRYPNEALEAELAYRRELIKAAAGRGTRRGSWFSGRRRQR